MVHGVPLTLVGEERADLLSRIEGPPLGPHQGPPRVLVQPVVADQSVGGLDKAAALVTSQHPEIGPDLVLTTSAGGTVVQVRPLTQIYSVSFFVNSY